MSDIEAAYSDRLDTFEVGFHRKLDALLQGMHHIISQGMTSMDHAAVLELAKAADKDLDDKVSSAVSAFEAYEASHSAMSDSLDDIGAILTAMPDKIAKLDAIKAPVDAAPAPAPVPLVPVDPESVVVDEAHLAQ